MKRTRPPAGARGATPVPRYAPQLATLVSSPPRGAAWIHELKYDGYRIGCRIESGTVTLISRNGNDFTAQFPTIPPAAAALPVEGALLDGEAVVVSS